MSTVQTSTASTALATAAAAVLAALDAPDGRLVLTAPPQEGLKTSLARSVILDALSRDKRVVYASYLHGVARNMARVIGESRGLAAVGVGGALTGFAADVLLVDDPHQPGDDEAQLQHAWEWLHTVAMCRLSPGGSAVVLATRHSPTDMPGALIKAGWPRLNFPALADGAAPDALWREPGVYLPSLRGRTATDWEQTRLLAGERRWHTMYQGNPPEETE